MAVREFEIVFGNSNSIAYYSAGETLIGKVILSTEAQHGLKSLRINFTGSARNSWFEERPNKEVVEIVEQEEYLNFEAEISLEGTYATEQRSEYGFEYELSSGLPPTFIGTYGGIAYAVCATLIKDAAPHEVYQTIRKEFILKGQVDLNTFPDASKPSEIVLSQPLLFENGSLGMEVKLENSGFVPGESLTFSSKLTNESTNEVQAGMSLIQETTYQAKNRRVSDIQIIASKPGPFIKPHSTVLWTGEILEIPTVPASVLDNCEIISLQYRVVIEMEVPSPSINLEGTIPIMIGTIALKRPANDPGKPLETEELVPDIQVPRMRKFRNRQNRPQTTCLVFRPDRRRQELPTPKPDTWCKRKPNAPSPKPTEHVRDSLKDTNSDDLIRELEVMHLIAGGEPGKPAAFGPSSTGAIEEAKPEASTRRHGHPARPARRHDKGPAPSKPNRKPKFPDPHLGAISFDSGPIPEFLGDVQMIKDGANSKNNADSPVPAYPSVFEMKGSKYNQSNKATLPYPKESRIILFPFPVPDFSFNVFVDGERREPIGWNITRNTLSLKRARGDSGFVLPVPMVGWSSDSDFPTV